MTHVLILYVHTQDRIIDPFFAAMQRDLLPEA